MGDAKRRRDYGSGPRTVDVKHMDYESAVDFVKQAGAAAYGVAQVLHNDVLAATSIFLITHEPELRQPDEQDSEISITHVYSEADSGETEIGDHEVDNVPKEARLVQYAAIPGGMFPSTIEFMESRRALGELRNASIRYAQLLTNDVTGG